MKNKIHTWLLMKIKCTHDCSWKKINIIFNTTHVFTFEFYIRMFDVFIWMAYGKAEIVKFFNFVFFNFRKIRAHTNSLI
jgi:hypothetical protein